MGDICNLGDPAELEKFVRGLDAAGLLAQEITQQAAVHAISSLLSFGCTEENAAQMLASLRRCAEVIRMEHERRGSKPMFDKDQTGFQ